MEILRLEKVIKYFTSNNKKKYVLNNVSYSFQNKGLYVIKGESGSGKSTLLNLLIGFEKVNEGKIYINSKDITRYRFKDFNYLRRDYVSMIYQNYLLLSSLSALDNVCLPMYIKYENKSKEQINKIGLELLKRYIPEIDVQVLCRYLSGGQKQRICILRAIISGSKIILADEPTGSLDKENGELIFKTLKDISKNKLVIVVTHDDELADKYADYLLVLKEGKLYEISK